MHLRLVGSPSLAMVAVLVIAPTLVGCGDEAPHAPASAVQDSAGVRVVTVPPERMGAPAPLVVADEPHLRVGAVDGDETELLSTPVAVARLSDGRIFLVEAGARRARLLDAEGGFVAWIGQVGDGPAEFQRASRGGVLPGDTLWIHDGGRQRLVLYDAEGRFQRAVAYERPGGAGSVRAVRFRPDGRIVDYATNLTPQAALQSVDGSFHERVMLHLLDREGQNPRLVVDGPGPLYRLTEPPGAEGRGIVMVQMVDPLFAPLFRIAVDDTGRIWTGSGDGFEVRRLNERGEVEEIFRSPGEPTPVTSGVWDAYLEASVSRAPAEAREGLQANLTDRDYADVLPAFQELVADEAGLLWVSEFVGHRPGERPATWWLIAPGDDLLGRLVLPPGLRVLSIGEDEILGVETDDFDVPYLVAYRLDRAH